MSTLRWNRRTWIALVALAVLAVALAAQTSWFRATKSATYDETIYLSFALQTVHDGRLDPEMAAHGTAPLPVLIAWLPSAVRFGGQARPDRQMGAMGDPPIVRSARLTNSLLIGVPLVLVVGLWLLSRRGALAATLGAGLTALSPSILAHVSVAATDACFTLFALLAVLSLCWLCRRPSPVRFSLAAVAVGAAIAAKYSGLFLLPVSLLAIAVGQYDRRQTEVKGKAADEKGALRSALLRASWQAVLFACLSLFACWAFHLFTTAEVGAIHSINAPQTPAWVHDMAAARLPSPLTGMLSQFLHHLRGHRAFLMGEVSGGPWWYYFPCAAWFKSTLSELLLMAGLLVFAARRLAAALNGRRLSDVGSGRPPPVDRSLLIVWSALIVYALLVSGSRLQIGQRYLLPMYPLIFIVAVDALWWLLQQRRRLLAAIATVLLIGQAASALTIAPHYLAYFSPLVGGSSQGHRLLGDSNIDWGQDLPLLRRKLDQLGCRRVLLSYFGTADPQAFGIESDDFDVVAPEAIAALAQSEQFDCVAISVNHLSGLYAPDFERTFVLRDVEPTARAGYSIMIFDLRSAEVREQIRANSFYQTYRRKMGGSSASLPDPKSSN